MKIQLRAFGMFCVLLMPAVCRSDQISLISGSLTISNTKDFCVDIRGRARTFVVFLTSESNADGLIKFDGDIVDRFSSSYGSVRFHKERPLGDRVEGQHTISIEVRGRATFNQFNFSTDTGMVREVSCGVQGSSRRESAQVDPDDRLGAFEVRLQRLESEVRQIKNQLVEGNTSPTAGAEKRTFQETAQKLSSAVDSLSKLVNSVLSDMKEVRNNVNELKSQPKK